MAARLELTLSEAFAKHKRNLMVLCSIIVVMAIAVRATPPTTLKVPGLGGDLAIPVPLAFGLLGIALIYVFATYFVEMLTLVQRHSKAILDGGNGTLDEKIAQKQQDLAKDFSSAQYLVSSLRTALSETEKVVKEVVGPQLMNKERLLSDKAQDIVGSMRQLDNLIKKADGMIDLIETSFHVHEKAIDDLKFTCENLDKKFDRLSNNISRTQRAGFWVLEQAIPMIFAAVALLVSIDGAFNHSRCANLIVGQLEKPAESADRK